MLQQNAVANGVRLRPPQRPTPPTDTSPSLYLRVVTALKHASSALTPRAGPGHSGLLGRPSPKSLARSRPAGFKTAPRGVLLKITPASTSRSKQTNEQCVRAAMAEPETSSRPRAAAAAGARSCPFVSCRLGRLACSLVFASMDRVSPLAPSVAERQQPRADLAPVRIHGGLWRKSGAAPSEKRRIPKFVHVLQQSHRWMQRAFENNPKAARFLNPIETKCL